MTALALGTVQFGLPYGITNHAGQVPEAEVRAILASAEAAGVDVLDTAASYGGSEQVLGRCMAPDASFRLITKTLPLNGSRLDETSLERIAAGIDMSMLQLGREHVEGILVHHAQDLMGPDGELLFELLQAQQGNGRIGKIGVSVYDGAQLEALLPRYPIEIVQLPLNVLDQRLLQSGWLHRLADDGIEVHVRSAFLQGVLLADSGTLPERIDVIRSGAARFHIGCAQLRVGRAAACLGFLRSLPEVSQVVCGVLSVAQFDELLEAWRQDDVPTDPDDYAHFALPDHPYLSPANWPPPG
jgi:aryl-alcohol dehydrogenase-like predicted oxidoreductase